jgi:hypothetical protein
VSEQDVRVVWKPVKDRTGLPQLGTGAPVMLGACVVIHVDQIPEKQPRPSLGQWLRGLSKPPEARPWEEHRGVVDHPEAERIAAELGVPLEID